MIAAAPLPLLFRSFFCLFGFFSAELAHLPLFIKPGIGPWVHQLHIRGKDIFPTADRFINPD